MTATPDAAEHPEVSEISDLTEDLLSPSRAVDVRHHLDGCALCADVHSSLEEIRGLLGTLPGPPRMPAEIAGRIDAALAAEALLDATAPQAAAPQSATPAAPSPDSAHAVERTAGGVSRETAPVPPLPASATAASDDGPPNRPAGHPRAATGPGRPSPGPRRRRRGAAVAVLGAAATVAAVGLGALLIQSGGGSDTRDGAGAQKAKQEESAADADTFSGDGLDDQVAALLAKGVDEKVDSTPSTAFGPDTESHPRTPHSPLLTSEPEVPECVRRGIDRAAPPLAAELGTYQGTRAYLVVLPHTSDGSRVSAYVVDASCADQGSSGTGDVLLTRSYPRR
ncbi:hypothetical protein ACX6XY_11375 [Streptomyces sp. O3]